MLEAYSNVQFYVVGPIGDEAGQYAATRLCALSRVEPLNKRLFVRAEFFRVTEEMRFAADFTICPSRTEPFGYVDVEYAWHGCPTIGNLVGGLGKVPGVYYQILEPGDHRHVLGQLLRAIDVALSMDAPTLVAAVRAGLDTSFPIEPWASALDDQYRQVLAFAEPMRARAAAAAELSRRLSAMGSTRAASSGAAARCSGARRRPGSARREWRCPGRRTHPSRSA